MKKFTSLFALLSCLCVVSAQADVTTIYINANNPEYQYYWWWGTDNAPNGNDWNTFKPKISTLPNVTINNISFYTLELTPSTPADGVGIKFREGGFESSNNSEIVGSEFYVYYFGDESCLNMSISGSLNNWKKNSLIPTNHNDWTYVYEIPQSGEDPQFKFRPNDSWLGYYDMDWSQNFFGVSEFSGNFKLDLNLLRSIGINSLKFRVYKEEGADKWKLDITAPTVSYERNGVSALWGTLCLPFAISNVSDLDMTFYKFSSVEGNVMKFESINQVNAGQPVVFKLDNSVSSFTISAQDVNNVVKNPANVIGDPWSTYGTFVGASSGDDTYFYISKVDGVEGVFYGTGITVPAYRAYFTGERPANPAPFRIEADDTEGLQFVEQEDGTVKAYFDLQGRKLDSARKGLVIENGKIIMVK